MTVRSNFLLLYGLTPGKHLCRQEDKQISKIIVHDGSGIVIRENDVDKMAFAHLFFHIKW